MYDNIVHAAQKREIDHGEKEERNAIRNYTKDMKVMEYNNRRQVYNPPPQVAPYGFQQQYQYPPAG